MNRYVQSTVMSCSILAAVIFLATSLSAQAPAGGAPVGAAPGGAPAMGGFGGGMGGGMPGGMGGFGGGAPGAGAGGAPAMGGFGGFGGGAPGGAAPGGMGGFGGFGGGQGGMPPMGGFGGGQGGMPRMGGMGGGMPRMGGMGGMGGGQPRDVKPEKREKMESIASTRTEFPDNKFKDMPQEYTRPNEKAGKIVSFKYKTRNHKTEGSAEIDKTCLVYLPAGYDEKDTKTQYNILYLMHGAGGNESTFFRGEGQNTPLKNTFDNMIAKGDIKPLIVVTPTLGSVDALDFHSELVKDLIPAVEKQYHTYAKDVTAEGVHASKWHRAFGGFSLGGVTTWAVFDHCIDQIGCYIPISGDSWIAGQFQGAGAAKYLAETFTQTGYKPTDFRIYSGCGSTSDMANRNLTPQIDAMKNYPDIFKYCDNFKDGNLYLAISEKSGHDNTTIMNTLYNGLPKMFE
jgi:enterochelin esterase-like enzyme